MHRRWQQSDHSSVIYRLLAAQLVDLAGWPASDHGLAHCRHFLCTFGRHLAWLLRGHSKLLVPAHRNDIYLYFPRTAVAGSGTLHLTRGACSHRINALGIHRRDCNLAPKRAGDYGGVCYARHPARRSRTDGAGAQFRVAFWDADAHAASATADLHQAPEFHQPVYYTLVRTVYSVHHRLLSTAANRENHHCPEHGAVLHLDNGRVAYFNYHTPINLAA